MENPGALILCFIFMAAISDTVAASGHSSPAPAPAPSQQVQPGHFAIASSPAPQPSQQEQPLGLHQSSPTSIFEPILNQLGFHELAMAVPSLHDSPSFSTWKGPSTVFAPNDASVNSCTSCSLRRLVSEHIVPGLYSSPYLRTLRNGSKIETMSSGHCLTVTSSVNRAAHITRIFIDGVEITSPDMFDNGLVVVHGLNGFVSALSSNSCSVEKAAPPQAPTQPPEVQTLLLPPPPPSPVMDLMLRDAILRLRTRGYGILALAMRIKYPDLVNLNNATLFALDDSSIFSGYQNYVSNIRFHIVPDHFLTIEDLSELPVGTVLPTLNRGQYLVVTRTSSARSATTSINYVEIRTPEIVKNPSIVIHSLFTPFPHLQIASSSTSQINDSPTEEP